MSNNRMADLDAALRTRGFVAKGIEPETGGGCEIAFSTDKERSDFLLQALLLGDFVPYVGSDFLVSLHADGVNRICSAWAAK